MSNTPLIAIPVPAHVRQFLLKEFGPDPHSVHQKTYIGKQVLMVAEKKPYRIGRAEVQPPEDKCYRIQLPKVLKHHSITQESRKLLGEALEKYFLDMLVIFIKGQVAATGNERAALRSFFDMYEINPDHYDLEAGRKQYRDYRDTVLRHNNQIDGVYQVLGALPTNQLAHRTIALS